MVVTPATAPRTESSVMLSIAELMAQEETRLREENERKESEREAIRRAQEEDERQQRRLEVKRLVAEKERHREQQRRAQEQEAKLAALRTAEMERASREARQHLQSDLLHQAEEAARSNHLIFGRMRRTLKVVSMALAGTILASATLLAGIVISMDLRAERRVDAATAQYRTLESEWKQERVSLLAQAERADQKLVEQRRGCAPAGAVETSLATDGPARHETAKDRGPHATGSLSGLSRHSSSEKNAPTPSSQGGLACKSGDPLCGLSSKGAK